MIYILILHKRSLFPGASLHELGCHEFGLVAILGILLEEIGEKEHLQYGKHDKELDADDEPERLAQCHLPETIIVKMERIIPETVLFHSYSFNATNISKKN